jgi:hypothetical protein
MREREVDERELCRAWVALKLREASHRWGWLGDALSPPERLAKFTKFLGDELFNQRWATRLVDDAERDMAAAYQDAQHYRERAEAALEVAAKYAECYAGRFPENVNDGDLRLIREARNA